MVKLSILDIYFLKLTKNIFYKKNFLKDFYY